MVFRRIYGEEIERVSAQAIEDDFKRQLDSAKRQTARYRGVAAEYKVRYRLHAASLAGAALADIVIGEAPPGFTSDRFTTIRKARFHLDQESSFEADLHALSERDAGTDLVVEVKDWERRRATRPISLGYRGEDLPRDRAPGEFRILAVGDSNTVGNKRTAWPNEIGGSPGAQGLGIGEITMINAGVTAIRASRASITCADSSNIAQTWC